MNKREFTEKLQKRLSRLPQAEVEERLAFYGEMIDDRIEEGLDEEDAVAEMGQIDRVAEQILSEIPLLHIARERVKRKRRMRTWEIVLLVLGSPLWLSLLIVAFAVLFAVYAVLWALLVSAWAVFVTFACVGVFGVVAGICIAAIRSPAAGLALLGAGLFLAGAAILTFFGCLAASRGTLILTKKIALGVKRAFVGRGGVEK